MDNMGKIVNMDNWVDHLDPSKYEERLNEQQKNVLQQFGAVGIMIADMIYYTTDELNGYQFCCGHSCKDEKQHKAEEGFFKEVDDIREQLQALAQRVRKVEAYYHDPEPDDYPEGYFPWDENWHQRRKAEED